MRLSYRLCFALIFGVAAVSLGFAFYQTQTETRGVEQELEGHALVLGEGRAKSAEPLVGGRSYRELQRLVDRFQNREQIAGIAVYEKNGDPLAVSVGLTSRLD